MEGNVDRLVRQNEDYTSKMMGSKCKLTMLYTHNLLKCKLYMHYAVFYLFRCEYRTVLYITIVLRLQVKPLDHGLNHGNKPNNISISTNTGMDSQWCVSLNEFRATVLGGSTACT